MSRVLPLVSIMSVMVVVDKVMTIGTRGVLDYKLLILKIIVLRGLYKVKVKLNTTGVLRVRCSGTATVTVRIKVRGDKLTVSLTATGFITGPLTALPKTVFDM